MNENFISVILVAGEDYSSLEKTLFDLKSALSSQYSDYEIILVLKRRVYKITKKLSQLHDQFESLRSLIISDPLSREIEYAAGAENSIGDIVAFYNYEECSIDSLISAIGKILEGDDLVIGISNVQKGLFYKFSSYFFRKILARYADYYIPQNATELRIVSRRALNYAIGKEKFLYQFYYNLSKTEFETQTFDYKSLKKSKRSAISGFREAIRVLVFNSTAPLKFINFIGLFGSFLGIMISVYSLLVHVFKDKPVEGWVSINLFMCSQLFIIFIILFFFGEYLVRLIETLKSGKEYEVISEKYSSVANDRFKRNVTSFSE